MQNENAENSMTQLVQLMGDIAEKGCADEIDSEPTSDFAKECWDRLREIYKEPEFRHSYSATCYLSSGYVLPDGISRNSGKRSSLALS